MSILVSGSLVYDHIMDFPDSFKNHIMPENIHILNVCFVVKKLQRSWGGTAGNIAFNIKMLESDPLIISAVGNNGNEYLDYFEKLNIKTTYIKKDENQLTASCYITTDADDNQITAFYNGPLDLAKNIDLEKIEESVNLAIISPTYKEAMVNHLEKCSQIGIKTVFDPGQQITGFSGDELKKMIKQAYFVIGNDYEIKLLQNKTNWSEKEILQNTKVLITTLGGNGSIIKTSEGEKIEIKPCTPLSVYDPTGAGDAYRAGFFVGYEKGLDLKTCGQIGSVVASYAVETYGTQEHKFTKDEFEKKYENAFGEKIIL